jgi:hypothetical protein
MADNEAVLVVPITKGVYPHLAKYFTQAKLIDIGPSKSGKAENFRLLFVGQDHEASMLFTQNLNSHILWMMPASPRETDTWKAYRCKPEYIESTGAKGTELARLCLEAYMLGAKMGIELLDLQGV